MLNTWCRKWQHANTSIKQLEISSPNSSKLDWKRNSTSQADEIIAPLPVAGFISARQLSDNVGAIRWSRVVSWVFGFKRRKEERETKVVAFVSTCLSANEAGELCPPNFSELAIVSSVAVIQLQLLLALLKIVQFIQGLNWAIVGIKIHKFVYNI